MKRGAWLRGKVRRARKRWRLAKGMRARTRAQRRERHGKAVRARRRTRKWEAALARFRQARKNPHPHLSGDLDSDRRVLDKLERLAVKIGRNIYVTSGNRTPAEQKRLYDNRHRNPFPVAFCCPCQSNHCGGNAADCLVGGVPIQNVVPASTIRSVGLSPLAGDAVHLEG